MYTEGVHMCVQACVHKCTHECGSSEDFSPFFSWDKISHWDLGLAKLLASKCQGSAGLHLPGAWITNVHHCVILFAWTLGIQLGSLTGYFHSQPPFFSFNLLALIRHPLDPSSLYHSSWFISLCFNLAWAHFWA